MQRGRHYRAADSRDREGCSPQPRRRGPGCRRSGSHVWLRHRRDTGMHAAHCRPSAQAQRAARRAAQERHFLVGQA